MALDRDAYFSYVDDLNRKAEEQAARAAEEARPFSEKAWNAAAGALDAAGGVLGEVGEGFVSSAARARDAYGRFWDARRASNEPRHVFMSRPDVQEAVDDLESAAVDFVMAPVKVFADHTLAPARSYVAGRIDAAADEGGEVAQNLRATETFVSYFMTPEDKLRKAREVEEDTGIPADAFLDDAALYKEALRIHDYTLRKKALMQDAFSMEAVFEEFPEIRAVAEMSPKDAALALHDIESVRQTHGIVESFTHFLEVGNRKLEYDNLQYKMATGTADENDRQRAADLEKLSDSDKKRLPSFFDDPLAMAAGGLASSAPEMLDSLREGVRDGLLTAEAAAIAGAAAGTAVEPVGGTLAGGALGAGGGFVAGFARSAFGSAARRAMVRTAMTRGMQAGMFEGMRRPESGARYAEYGEMKDKEGNPLLSEDERRLYAVVGGAANAAIEMWNAGLFAKPLRGLNLFGREGGYGADAIRAVIDRAKYDAASRESVAFFAKEQVKDVLKIAVTESLEEGAQSLADDLIHNEIVDAADGRAADEAISPGDMAVRALVRTAEAFPVGVGFGLAAPLGSAGAVLRHARRLSSEQAREEAQVQHTLTGTVMLDGLQQVSSSAKLKQTAPDVQQEIIRAQVQGSGFEAAYVDTVAALQSPEGAKDLEAVARAAGISDEELSETIAREGLLYVPVEKYAQSAASPALLEAVSFSPEADSIARMKMNARALTDAMEKAQKDAIKARTQAVHAIVNAWFPEAPVHADEKEKLRRDADREMAVAAITQDPDSPAHGWRALYDAFTVERDALLHPALDALARGMKKGVDILQNGPDGRGIRVSNNAPWYQEFYAAHGRAPRKDELMELAYLLTVGDVSAPKVEGWMPSSQEAADAMEAARGQLDELNAHIGTLSNIKDRMMQLDAAEVRATQGLTPEAYGVYHAVMAKLREIGGVQAQAARMNALLFAARADAVARVMREKGGRPDYTARDYFDGFVLRYGGRYADGGMKQTAGMSADQKLEEDAAAWEKQVDEFMSAADKNSMRIYRVMDTPLVFSLLNQNGFHVQLGKELGISHAMLWKVLREKEVKGVSHGHALELTPEMMKELPRALADPMMILRNRRGDDPNAPILPDEIIAVVDTKDKDGSTIIVPIVLKEQNGRYMLKTFFGKRDVTWFQKRMMLGDVLYAHKKRALSWVKAIQRHQSPGRFTLQDSFFHSIPTDEDLVKLREEYPGFYQRAWHGSPYEDAVSSQMAAVRKQYEGTPQWMMAPNGKPTNLTEEEWLAVRTPAFKAAFGDWEQVAQRQRYLNTAPIEVAEKQIVKSEGVTVMEAAFRWAAAHLPVQVATPFGTVEINRASVKDSLGHGFSQKKLDAVTSLPEGMKVAAFIGEEQDFGGADINNGYFCYPIMYQGEKQVVFVRARRDVNSNKLYVHEVWTEDEIKDIPLQTAAKFLNSKPHGGNVLYKSILAEFLHGDKGVSPNLLDENGEPLPSVLSSRHNQEQQRAIYGEFSKENGKKIITLFAGANPSTMLHEMGHMFLDDLDELAQFDEASAKDLATVNEWAEWHEGAAKEYENTPWAEEFRAHEAAIRDALKSGDAIALRAARNRWRHERFARGFELYLYEGKASSKALRGVFRRFKQLLRRIYQFVKDVGGKPSPEVEAVMARMIASEEEIKAAELDERWRPVEKMGGKEALDDLLGDDVADTYAKWLEEARRDAEDILRARVMKNLEKEARAEFKERVEEERERKRVQLENEPVYLAEAAIRAQGDERAALLFFPSVEAYKEERAKRKSPEEELQDAMEVFAKGLDEELMAAALSDENVARAMQTPEAYHRRVAIEREALRAKERLARYVGGAPKEEDAAPAQEEGTGKEAEGTQEERRRAYEEAAFQNARYLRAEARRLLAESPISESCNPEFFRRKERSHARAAARAAAQGRWDEALSAKDAQALAAACAYEAAKNASKVDALKKDVQKKLGARTVRLAPNERYWLHHIAYLLGLKSSDAEKPVDGKSLSALFDEYRENNDVDAADPSDLLELITQKKRSYTAMRLGDFADVVDALRILYTIGRDRNRMKSVAGKTVEEVCDEMMADPAALRPEGVVEHPVSEDTGGLGYSELLAKVPGIGEVIARLTQKGALPLLKPEIMIRLLGEKAHGYLYGTYERAQMRESELIGEKSEALDEIFSVYSRKERMGWKERNIDAHGDMLSKENVLCLALNWGTETNRKRVMDDIGQRMDVPRTLREHMTERDWKVVQEVWDLIDTFWEESARTEEELNGAHLGKVPAAAFTIETADGHTAALRGGYYPIRYNPKKSARVNDKDVEAQAKNRMTGAQVFGTKRSHTKARSEGDVVLPVRLEFAVLQEHLYNAAHNIAFRIAARDVYRVMNNKGFEQYVCARYGRPVYDYLKQWTVDVWAIPADGSDAAMDALSRAMAAFRRNSTMAIMGWRMWPVLENVSNIGPVMDRLGAREALRAVLAFVRSPRALIRRARKSIFMADRMNNMERDLRRDPHIFDPTFSVLEFLRDNAYRPLVFTDLMLSIPTWNSAYERAFPEAMAEIRRENEENRRTYEAAQEDVNRLRAEVYDLRQESAALRDEMEKRKAPVPAAMQGSRYAGLSDAELSAEEERVREAFAAKEKEFYEAGLRLERAGELPILDEKERIKEAELRAVQVGDAAVRDTFGSGQTKDLSAIQRSRSELTKMFTSFYSFFNTQFNALAESYFKGKYAADGWAHVRVWMPLARSVLCRMVLVMIIGAIGKAVLGLDGDGERDRYRMVKDPKSGKMVREEVPWEERFMKVLGRNVLSTATGLTPVVRDLSGFVSARIFDGQTSGRNFELGSVAARGLNQVEATVDLMIKMGKQELEREEKEEAERARLRKMSPKERRRYEEEKKYRKPKKEVGVLDVMRSGAQAVSTFTAARTGVTNTLSDGLFSLLQYAEDMMESDNYYDPDVRNVLRAVFFDKKLRPKEVPPKPEKPKRGKARRGGSERSGR